MPRNLIVDLNNNIFTLRFGKLKTPSRNERKDPYAKELIFLESLKQIAFFANEFKCDAIVIARDSPDCWRKDIFPDYKNRDHDDDVYFEDTIASAELAVEFFMTCTNALVLEAPRSEADDVISVFCQQSDKGVENIILSSDKDFVQLLNDRTLLYSPPQKKFRVSDDPEYDLFLKCIRGDINDNISSAFPRVRETRLKKAWEDEVEMLNLMETVRKSDGRKVSEALDFNLSLIDLKAQPTVIKEGIVREIEEGLRREKRYSEMRIMRFLGDNNLKEFSDLLEYKERPFRGTPVFRVNK